MTVANPNPVVDFAALVSAGSLSRHELTRYIAGELSDARRQEIASLIEGDAAVKAQHDDVIAEQKAFYATMPFARFERDHEARRTETGGASSWATRVQSFFSQYRIPAAGALTAACALLVVVNVADFGSDPGAHRDANDGVRLKGGARVGLFVKDQSGAHLVSDGESLIEGDQVQIVVRDALQRRSMVVLGIDGKGAVTVYEARTLEGTHVKGEQVAKGEEAARLLEESLILDDAAGPERFFAIYADVDVHELQARATDAATALVKSGASLRDTVALPLDVDGAVQGSVHIVKVER